MVGREELLQGIHPGMKLNKTYFLKIYGYEITWPGFKDIAISALESAGCSRAREYYDSIVSGYEKGYQGQIREVGKWYQKKCEKKWNELRMGGDAGRKQEQENLQRMSNSDLIALLENLISAT